MDIYVKFPFRTALEYFDQLPGVEQPLRRIRARNDEYISEYVGAARGQMGRSARGGKTRDSRLSTTYTFWILELIQQMSPHFSY